MLISIHQLAMAYATHGWTQDADDPTSFYDSQGWVSAHGHIGNVMDVRLAIEDIAVWSPALARKISLTLVTELTAMLEETLKEFPDSYEIPC